MNLKIGFIYSVSLVAFFFLLSFNDSNGAEIDPYPNVIIPVFKGGHDVQKNFDTGQRTKSIRYYVQTGSPPSDVLEFYDAYFNGRGWRSSFETCQRNWEDPGTGTETAESDTRQLFASWEHSEKNLRAVLWLTYKVVKEGRLTQVTVICRLKPKVDG
jgi:hypothetical protein